MTRNPLSDIDGKWVGDGSEGVLSLSLPELSIESQRKGSPCNVILDCGESSLTNNFYFEIEITKLEGNISIGVVKKDDFHPGYKTKGMFYNGNVTNGSAALIVAFGEYVKEGSTIGVAVFQHEVPGTLKTIFYLNGFCLGVAFTLEGVQPGSLFWPCIHVSGKATVKYIAPPNMPEDTERKVQQHEDAYLGDWKIEKLLTGPELHEFSLPPNHDIVMSLRKEDRSGTTYDFSVKVANTLATNIVVKGKAEAFDSIEVGPTRATMMMPPPDLEPLESLVASSLPKLFKMIYASDKLIMTGADVELTAHRYLKSFQPLERYN